MLRWCPVSSHAASVPEDGLGGLGHSVLAHFSAQGQAHGHLDVSGGHGGMLVGEGQAQGPFGNALEDVLHEQIHDVQSLLQQVLGPGECSSEPLGNRW